MASNPSLFYSLFLAPSEGVAFGEMIGKLLDWVFFQDQKKTFLAVGLFAWRMAQLPFYYHHDLASIIYSVRCWCFPYYTPYGYIWYLLNYPLTFNYPLMLALIDLPILLLIRMYRLFWIYLPVTFILYTAAPYDLPIVWLSLAGALNPFLLLLAPLAKFPDTVPMWNFTLHRGADANDLEYYIITAIPWFWILFVQIGKFKLNRMIRKQRMSVC
ncbi:MAG TPA: hypothetical protein VF910_07230 [Candidatus Bathyarchaeia archaeon]